MTGNMKQLKFADPLPQLILDGKKSTAWRIDDKKNIARGDRLSLCCNDGREFAKAVVIRTKETFFKDLTDDDKEGHEKFSSEEDMYQTYSRYYNMRVNPKTRLKIIKFRLLS